MTFSHHRYITEWNPDRFIREAAAIHPDVEAYIRQVMEEKKHPEQAYKSCQGILSFACRVGNNPVDQCLPLGYKLRAVQLSHHRAHP